MLGCRGPDTAVALVVHLQSLPAASWQADARQQLQMTLLGALLNLAEEAPRQHRARLAGTPLPCGGTFLPWLCCCCVVRPMAAQHMPCASGSCTVPPSGPRNSLMFRALPLMLYRTCARGKVCAGGACGLWRHQTSWPGGGCWQLCAAAHSSPGEGHF